MNKKVKFNIIILVIIGGLLLSGCTASPEVRTKWADAKTQSYYENRNNPKEFRYQPVIGTKQPDTKMMIDMGEWAKIWVKNYKNENQTFVASHSIVTKVREPGFIAGEQIPRSRRDTVSNTYGGRSFSFRSNDLNYDNSSQGSYGVTDSEIKDYMNSFEYSKKTQRMEPQKREDVLKYDKAIKDYIKKAKEDKEVQKEEERLMEKKRIEQAKNEKSDAVYDSEDENGGLK
ncbi:MAG: hypothetical protein PHS42_04680 [Sulfurimonas sp.]|nr:hypothetical protein [Sulfurimonas sp.]